MWVYNKFPHYLESWSPTWYQINFHFPRHPVTKEVLRSHCFLDALASLAPAPSPGGWVSQVVGTEEELADVYSRGRKMSQNDILQYSALCGGGVGVWGILLSYTLLFSFSPTLSLGGILFSFTLTHQSPDSTWKLKQKKARELNCNCITFQLLSSWSWAWPWPGGRLWSQSWGKSFFF